MSSQLPAPAGSNTFERIKRVSAEGHEFWSARDLAQVLEYTNFRNFFTVIAKAREACASSGHTVFIKTSIGGPFSNFRDITEPVFELAVTHSRHGKLWRYDTKRHRGEL